MFSLIVVNLLLLKSKMTKATLFFGGGLCGWYVRGFRVLPKTFKLNLKSEHRYKYSFLSDWRLTD